MLKLLKRKLKSQKGAMDKILVTLLLVVIAMVAVGGLGTWMKGQVQTMQNKATTEIGTASSSS